MLPTGLAGRPPKLATRTFCRPLPANADEHPRAAPASSLSGEAQLVFHWSRHGENAWITSAKTAVFLSLEPLQISSWPCSERLNLPRLAQVRKVNSCQLPLADET